VKFPTKKDLRLSKKTGYLHLKNDYEDLGMMMDHRAMGDGMGDIVEMASDKNPGKLPTKLPLEFDITFLSVKIEHHKGALNMVQMIQNSQNEVASALAQEFFAAQQADVRQVACPLQKLTND